MLTCAGRQDGGVRPKKFGTPPPLGSWQHSEMYAGLSFEPLHCPFFLPHADAPCGCQEDTPLSFVPFPPAFTFCGLPALFTPSLGR
jgi:hypothetical protein